MNYLSVCSGIEAATVAWNHMGWQPVGFSEIEPFPSAVLAHHYSNVPNLGDMTKYKEWNIAHPDIIVGGTPCQSFSVAGLRKGMDDPRGNLALVYCGLLDYFRPRWFVWENVPGVLSSSGGRDFGAFLGALAELGYGFAYRVLDAQFFGVAQRRRRVFVVGYLGDWRPPAAVLFERQSLRRDTPPSREARKDTATSIGAGLIEGIDYENNAHGSHDPTGPLLKGSSSGGGHPLPAVITMAHGQGGAEIAVNRTPTLTCIHEAPIAAYAIQGNMIGRSDTAGPQGSGISEEISFTMTKADIHGVAQPIPFGVSEKPDVAHCLRSGASKADKHESTTYVAQPMAFAQNSRNEVRLEGGDGSRTGALTSGGGKPGQGVPMVVQPIPIDLRNAGRDPEKHDAVNRQGVGVGEAGDPAHTVTSACVHGVAQPIVLEDQGGSVINVSQNGIVGTLRRETHGHEPCVIHGRQDPCVSNIAFALGRNNGGENVLPQPFKETADCLTSSYGTKWNGNSSANNGSLFASHGMAVRRLTPVECERLQGFPDGYTNIPWRKQPESPDGPRYKALGNSMAVPVMRWIGERIQMVGELL